MTYLETASICPLRQPPSQVISSPLNAGCPSDFETALVTPADGRSSSFSSTTHGCGTSPRKRKLRPSWDLSTARKGRQVIIEHICIQQRGSRECSGLATGGKFIWIPEVSESLDLPDLGTQTRGHNGTDSLAGLPWPFFTANLELPGSQVR